MKSLHLFFVVLKWLNEVTKKKVCKCIFFVNANKNLALSLATFFLPPENFKSDGMISHAKTKKVSFLK